MECYFESPFRYVYRRKYSVAEGVEARMRETLESFIDFFQSITDLFCFTEFFNSMDASDNGRALGSMYLSVIESSDRI